MKDYGSSTVAAVRRSEKQQLVRTGSSIPGVAYEYGIAGVWQRSAYESHAGTTAGPTYR